MSVRLNLEERRKREKFEKECAVKFPNKFYNTLPIPEELIIELIKYTKIPIKEIIENGDKTFNCKLCHLCNEPKWFKNGRDFMVLYSTHSSFIFDTTTLYNRNGDLMSIVNITSGMSGIQ